MKIKNSIHSGIFSSVWFSFFLSRCGARCREENSRLEGGEVREMQSRCGEEAFVEKRGKSARGQGERDRGEEGAWTSGLETRVMAFLVLGCVRTLTLLAHIRAWSWLLSDFLHGAAASCACAPLFSRPISLRFCLPAPEKPDLRPNYPNPFAFSLPLSAHCRSTIKLDRRSKRIFFFSFM